MTFDALVVHDHDLKQDQGWVTFSAHLSRDGADHSFAERSEFRRVGSRWLYFAGEPVATVSGVTDSTANGDA